MRHVLLSVFLIGCGTQAASPAEQPLGTAPMPAPSGPALLPAAIAQLSPESRAALDASPVPMLVLPAERAAITTVMTGERWAALHARDAELTITLHATDVAHPAIADEEAAHVPPAQHTVRGQPARVMLNEQIRSVAWSEGATSYALEVECARPMDDPRCTEEDFVLELADALVAAPRGAR